MTAQVPDRFTYNQKQYSLAGVNGTGLFSPSDHGMKLTSPHTACWRGFVAHYDVREKALRMESLAVWSDEAETLPLLMYGAPLRLREGEVEDPLEGSYSGAYENCPEPVPFTGGILLADGFISELYEHMGYHPAWKFQEVHELVFEEGRLVKASDRSAQAQEYRERQAGTRPKFTSAAEHMAWIADTFDLRYGNWSGD